MEEECNSAEHQGRTAEQVAQCGGTVWNSMVEQWNSVAQCGGTVWNGMVKQCNSMVERRNSVVEQCATAW